MEVRPFGKVYWKVYSDSGVALAKFSSKAEADEYAGVVATPIPEVREYKTFEEAVEAEDDSIAEED
jgi:hypothetical protein